MIRIAIFLAAMLPAVAVADGVDCNKKWITVPSMNEFVYTIPYANIHFAATDPHHSSVGGQIVIGPNKETATSVKLSPAVYKSAIACLSDQK